MSYNIIAAGNASTVVAEYAPESAGGGQVSKNGADRESLHRSVIGGKARRMRAGLQAREHRRAPSALPAGQKRGKPAVLSRRRNRQAAKAY